MLLYLKLYLILIISMFNYLLIPTDVPATYKDTFTKATHHDYQEAFKLGSQIPNEQLKIKPFHSNDKTINQAVGKVTSDKTGKSGNGATGFVVDDHTVITASHVASDDDGNKEKKQFYFFPAKSNQYTPLKFKIKQFYKSNERDVTVLITEKSLTPKIKPLTIASEREIQHLKPKSALFMAGYPNEEPYDGQYMYQSKGFYLKPTQDYIEYIGHMHRTIGFSGSPVFNQDNHVIGIHAHGIRPTEKVKNPSTRDKYTGGPLITGKTKAFIEEHKK
ncbi:MULTISPECIES: serine protease [Mammaliicoccus]|nr:MULTISPECIES: serine protease [Mammaliicoccus]MCJ0915322.1 serine protease [Mammaliicoccus sciuri]MDL0111897.1 serine protease [Mammaliicoccus sciuri]WQJ65612.1 serine protease [Mammaliicoccus sciuri]